MKLRYLILLFIGFHLTMKAQPGFKFETDKNKITIPFRLINNLIFIPIQVNGIELNFLLDSGVEETILLSLEDKGEVSFNNVKKIKLRGLGSEESIEGLKSSNNILSLGDGLIDRNHDLYIVLDQGFNFSSHVGIPVNGIIGYHFFKNNLVEVNYSRKKIIVYKNTKKIMTRLHKNFNSFPMTVEKNKPYMITDVTIENESQPSKLLIDLGNSDAIWLFPSKEKKIQIPKLNFEDFLGKGFSGDINGYRAKISKLKLTSFEFENPIIAFPDSISIKSVNMVKDRVGSVGGEILKRFNVVFDYPHDTIYLQKSKFFSEPFTYNMSGIELQNEGLQWVQETVQLQTVPSDGIAFDAAGEKIENNFKYKFTLMPLYTISSIRKNSPAEQCGLLKGDLIKSINGVDGYRYSLEEINELLKSEEGKWLRFDVERNGYTLKFRFQLKSML